MWHDNADGARLLKSRILRAATANDNKTSKFY